MNKTVLEESLKENLNNNFEKCSKYFEYKNNVFTELGGTTYEITKCLVLGLNKSAITLTNHMLERLLKLSLISNEVGISPIPFEEWNTIFEKANKNYGSLTIGNSIEQCFKQNLISKSEKDILFKELRECMRNGFSHADAGKILQDHPDEIVGFTGKLSGKQEIKQISLNQKNIPSLQQVQMDNFAKSNALNYFNYVFHLMMEIEKRLIERKTN